MLSIFLATWADVSDEFFIFSIMLDSILNILLISLWIFLLTRYMKKKTLYKLNIAYLFVFYSAALFTFMIGKLLYHFYGVGVQKTELGIFANWSMPLFFIILTEYSLFNLNRSLFTGTLKENSKVVKMVKIFTFILIIMVFSIPRFIMAQDIFPIYYLKFVFTTFYSIYITWDYIYKSRVLLSFNTDEILNRKIKYTSMVYLFTILGIISLFLLIPLESAGSILWFEILYLVGMVCLFLMAFSGLMGWLASSKTLKDGSGVEEKNN